MTESIDLQDRDIRIFKLILEQKFLTRPHIVDFIFKGHKSAAKARLQKLVRLGFLVAVRPFTSQPQCYLLSKKGVLIVKDSGCAVGKVGGFPITYGINLPRPQQEIELINYEHDRKVTDVRLLLEGEGLIKDWQSEKFLKMGRKGERKVPDGIFTVAGKQIAVEVELKPKSSDRYNRILQDYHHHRTIDAVFYIGGGRKILAKISKWVSRTGDSPFIAQKPFYFTTYDELMLHKQEARMITRDMEELRLSPLLTHPAEFLSIRPPQTSHFLIPCQPIQT